MYEGLNVKSRIALVFNAIFIGRRLILALSITFVPNTAFQVQLILLSSIATFVYSCSVRPFTENSVNFMDMFNETTIMLLSYLTVPFTDYLLEAEFKYKIGWIIIAVFLTNLAINILYILLKIL